MMADMPICPHAHYLKPLLPIPPLSPQRSLVDARQTVLDVRREHAPVSK